MRTVAGGAHDGDELLHLWADRRDTADPWCVAVGRRGSPAAPPAIGVDRAIEQQLGHDPSSGCQDEPRINRVGSETTLPTALQTHDCRFGAEQRRHQIRRHGPVCLRSSPPVGNDRRSVTCCPACLRIANPMTIAA
jgi:hypothetical protein